MAYEGGNQQASEHGYDCLLFDLDDTLYPLGSGLASEVRKNIQDYMVQKLGVAEDKVQELCLSLYKFYGTTMAGLKAVGYNFDADDFHSFVHGRLPYTILKPDPVLRNLLLGVPIRKVIFTNADKAHAVQVLSRLGLENCFEGIITFETLNPDDAKSESPVDTHDADTRELTANSSTEIFDISAYIADPDSGLGLPKTPVICKPSEGSFKKVFEIANIDPRKTLFFDDSIRNIQTAKRMGLHTVLVGTSHRTEGVDIALEHIHNLEEALPEVWKAADEMSENMSHNGERVADAVETMA